MDRPKCKLCSRTFANGRALGGHMKAHLATLPLPLPPANPFSFDDEYDEAEAETEAAALYRLRENPRRSLKFSDPDDESESETELDSARRPSKRGRGRRQLSLAAGEDEEAAIAMCLVMLSRDKWRNTAVAKNTDVIKRHRCEVCNKSFRSSQALGGHRVTHRVRKAMNVKAEAEEEEEDVAAAEKYRKRFAAEGEKIFECPFCFKVFSSGQALGGHKRSHANGSGNVPAVSSSDPTPSHKQKQSSLIDLNLPAQPDEEDDCSVVSDGEITDPPERI